MIRIGQRAFLLGVAVFLLFASPCFAALDIGFFIDSPFEPTASVSEASLIISDIASQPYLLATSNQAEQLVIDTSTVVISVPSTQNIAFQMLGKIFNYPNPFSFSSGQTEIGYRLSKEAYLTFKVFSLTGHLIYSLNVTPDDYGKAAYNKIPFSRNSVGDWIPPGTYHYVLLYEDKVLAKNRMVIMP